MHEFESELIAAAAEMGFTQQGEVEVARFVGALTRLIRPRRALELGTGLGLTTYHILNNLPPDGSLDSVENDETLINFARSVLSQNGQLTLHHLPGEDFIGKTDHTKAYDLVFADTWPGKYTMLNETLEMVEQGGYYIVDDLNHQENWPHGHSDKVEKLLRHFATHQGWTFAYYSLGTGVGIAQKKVADPVGRSS